MKIEELEALRKRIINIFILKCITVLLAFILYYYISIPGIVLSLVILMFLELINKNQKKLFIDSYKHDYVSNALSDTFNDLKYDKKKGISLLDIEDTKLLIFGSHLYSNDYISGTYKNVFFETSDILLTNESIDSNHKTTYFKGQWMIFDFNKTFKANIKVREKDFKYGRDNGITDEEDYKEIKIADIDFNNKFNIYAQNELEAFYVLTPNLITKLKEIEASTKSRMLFGFIDNKLHVAINNNKDNFEISYFKKITKESITNNIRHDINLITSLVDVLDLEVNIFT